MSCSFYYQFRFFFQLNYTNNFVLVGDVLLGNKDSISSPLPDSRVELPETGSFPASSICSPSNTFRSPSQTEKEENQGKASASTFRSLSQTEKEDNQGKASANQNHAESVLKNSGTHNTLSAAQVQKRDTVSKDERSSSPEINVVVDLSKKDTADLDTDVSKRQSALVITTNNASIVSLVVVYNSNRLIVIQNSEWYYIYCLYFVIEFLPEFARGFIESFIM